MPEVSVIIPVYNVEKYLKRCIDSLIKQTFQNYELILINDGSKDSSLEILETYKNNKKIRVFDQKNMGPAKTRNKGIKLSKGKYVMFIDSDDYVLPDYIEHYYQAIQKGDLDLVIGGYQKVTGEHVDFVRKLKKGEFAKYVVVAPYCKMYKKSFLESHQIEFLDTSASEDVYFNVLAYSKNPKIDIVDDVGYFYYYNPSSLSNTVHKGFNQKVDILGLVQKINYEEIDNVELNQYFIIRYLIWYLLYSGKTASSKEMMMEYKKFFDWLRKNIPNYRNNQYIKHCPKGEIKQIHFYIHTFMVLDRLKLIKLFSKIYCVGGKI